LKIYSINEAIKGLWRNRMMSVASITSVAGALLILGVILILIINLNSLTEGAKNQFDTITAYVQEGLTKEQVLEIGNKINSLENVEAVIFETKEQALENMKKEFGDNAYLLDGLELNPFPYTFIIEVSNIEKIENLVSDLKTISGLEEIKYYGELINKVINITNYVRNLGFVLIIFLALISTLIINNTIKLAINSRKREISIMRYVGATSWFIRWPFLLEGTILGFLGAITATGLVYLIYNSAYKTLTSDFYVIVAAYVVNSCTLINEILIINIVLGAGIGALGSTLSIRKHLRM
jgi:cell division transport system permease protein